MQKVNIGLVINKLGGKLFDFILPRLKQLIKLLGLNPSNLQLKLARLIEHNKLKGLIPKIVIQIISRLINLKSLIGKHPSLQLSNIKFGTQGLNTI